MFLIWIFVWNSTGFVLPPTLTPQAARPGGVPAAALLRVRVRVRGARRRGGRRCAGLPRRRAPDAVPRRRGPRCRDRRAGVAARRLARELRHPRRRRPGGGVDLLLADLLPVRRALVAAGDAAGGVRGAVAPRARVLLLHPRALARPAAADGHHGGRAGPLRDRPRAALGRRRAPGRGRRARHQQPRPPRGQRAAGGARQLRRGVRAHADAGGGNAGGSEGGRQGGGGGPHPRAREGHGLPRAREVHAGALAGLPARVRQRHHQHPPRPAAILQGTLSLPPSLLPSLPPSLTHSLTPSLTRSLPACLPGSFYRARVRTSRRTRAA